PALRQLAGSGFIRSTSSKLFAPLAYCVNDRDGGNFDVCFELNLSNPAVVREYAASQVTCESRGFNVAAYLPESDGNWPVEVIILNQEAVGKRRTVEAALYIDLGSTAASFIVSVPEGESVAGMANCRTYRTQRRQTAFWPLRSTGSQFGFDVCELPL